MYKIDQNKLLIFLALLATGLSSKGMTPAQYTFLQDVESGNITGVRKKIAKSPEILADANFVDECLNYARAAGRTLKNAQNGGSPKLPGQPDPEWNMLINNCRGIAKILKPYTAQNRALSNAQHDSFLLEPAFFCLSHEKEFVSQSYSSRERHSQIHARPYLVATPEKTAAQPVAVARPQKMCPGNNCIIL